jgi:ribosomal protein S18 acetylase RimI-like enzyme
MELIIARAELGDATEILTLQRLAYQSEAEIYGDDRIPPLTQTLPALEEELREQVVLKALLDDRIVGSVRARVAEGTCYVGRLIVHPEVQNRGIGTRLLAEIERCFAGPTRFELFTGHRSVRNLYLYRKLGYSEFRLQRLSPKLTLVYLEKRGTGEGIPGAQQEMEA